MKYEKPEIKNAECSDVYCLWLGYKHDYMWNDILVKLGLSKPVKFSYKDKMIIRTIIKYFKTKKRRKK